MLQVNKKVSKFYDVDKSKIYVVGIWEDLKG